MVSFHSFFSLPEMKIEPKPDCLSPNKRKWPQLEEHEVDVALQLRPPASTINVHRTDNLQENVYNNQARKRSREPRQQVLSLDLKLNLSSQSNLSNQWSNVDSLIMASSTTEVDQKEENEMLAAVCSRCNMLVMLCKSSPSCPNCKFLHSPVQTSFRHYF